MDQQTEFGIKNGKLIQYKGDGGDVVVPEGVTEIGKYAFSMNRKITSVTLPSSLKKIGERVFVTCSALESVILPDSLTEIGSCAFQNCTSLKNIRIPESVCVIEPSAFSYCRALKSITIPRQVEKLPYGLFYACSSLTEVGLPEGVKEIGMNCFAYCSVLCDIRIPNGIEKIDSHAFEACSALVDYGDLSEETFEKVWNGTELPAKKKVVFSMLKRGLLYPSVISKIKGNREKYVALATEEDNAAAVADVFSFVKRIRLDELDRYIESASGSPKVLAYLIDYKNEKYSIEEQEKLSTEAMEKELGIRERSTADWKKIYRFEPCDGGIIILAYKGLETEVMVPEKIGGQAVIAIGDHAFSPLAERLSALQRSARENLTAVFLPHGVKTIGAGAFSKCKNLVTFSGEGLEKVGEKAFCECEALLDLAFPKNFTDFQADVFKNCPALADGDGCVVINGVFVSYYGKEKRLTLPKGVTRICREAFEASKSLEAIEISEE